MPLPPDISVIAQHCELIYRSDDVKAHHRTFLEKVFEPISSPQAKMAVTYKGNLYGSYAQAYREYRANSNANARLWCEHIKAMPAFQLADPAFRLATRLLSIITKHKYIDALELRADISDLSNGHEDAPGKNSVAAFSTMVQMGLLYETLRKELSETKFLAPHSHAMTPLLQQIERQAYQREAFWATIARTVRDKIQAKKHHTINYGELDALSWVAPPIILYGMLGMPGAVIGTALLVITVPIQATYRGLSAVINSTKNSALDGQKKAVATMASAWMDYWENPNELITLSSEGLALQQPSNSSAASSSSYPRASFFAAGAVQATDFTATDFTDRPPPYFNVDFNSH